MSGSPAAWEDPPELEFDPGFEVECSEAWRGDLHPECDEPGWPEPPPESEYGLLKREAEGGDA